MCGDGVLFVLLDSIDVVFGWWWLMLECVIGVLVYVYIWCVVMVITMLVLEGVVCLVCVCRVLQVGFVFSGSIRLCWYVCSILIVVMDDG